MSAQVFSRDSEYESKKASLERGIFGVHSSPESRIITDHVDLLKKINACRELGQSIVVTSGSFDLTHIGHARYLEAAKSYGDILVVGVDSDEKVRERKGESRPVVPDDERMEMLANLRPVDLVTIKHLNEPKWELIKNISPDTLIVTRETYDEATLQELTEFCGQVICLDPQAATSASAKVRLVEVGWGRKIREPIESLLIEEGVSEEVRRKVGKILTREYEPEQR
ncbi:MAG: adenylyltransferase/cytidyltransferase family protein [Candidatus Saccharibacteria bacterium]